MQENQFDLPGSIVQLTKVVWRDSSKNWDCLGVSDRQGIIDPFQYTLSYLVTGQNNFVLSSQPSGINEWLFVIEGSQLNFPTGQYWAQWQFQSISDEADLYQGGSLPLKITENYGLIQPSNTDRRSPEEKQLEAVDNAILAILEGRTANYSINGRNATFLDIDKLEQIKSNLQHRIARQKGRNGGKSKIIFRDPRKYSNYPGLY